MNKRRAAFVALLALISGEAAAVQSRDPANPTCPPNPDWSTYAEMRFTVRERSGAPPALLAEGAIDEAMLPRLQQALDGFRGREIWLRSPGGDAHAGNQAAMLIRNHGLSTRVPSGWACLGACAFMFMGGLDRAMDPDGLLIVQMFTFTSDPSVRRRLATGGESRERLFDEIAVASAAQASEDNDLLIRMGVSRRILTEIVYRQPGVAGPGHSATRRCLTLEEARNYYLVTEGGSAR